MLDMLITIEENNTRKGKIKRKVAILIIVIRKKSWSQ